MAIYNVVMSTIAVGEDTNLGGGMHERLVETPNHSGDEDTNHGNKNNNGSLCLSCHRYVQYFNRIIFSGLL